MRQVVRLDKVYRLVPQLTQLDSYFLTYRLKTSNGNFVEFFYYIFLFDFKTYFCFLDKSIPKIRI
jgi:hypothetical protein